MFFTAINEESKQRVIIIIKSEFMLSFSVYLFIYLLKIVTIQTRILYIKNKNNTLQLSYMNHWLILRNFMSSGIGLYTLKQLLLLLFYGTLQLLHL